MRGDTLDPETGPIRVVHSGDYGVGSGCETIFRNGVPHGSTKADPPNLAGFLIMIERNSPPDGHISRIAGLLPLAASDENAHGHFLSIIKEATDTTTKAAT